MRCYNGTMEAISHTVALWADEAMIVTLGFLGMVLFHYLSKLWSAPADAVFGAILGASIGIAVGALFLSHHLFGMHLSARALWFIALYLWCVLGMVFFARNTHRIKLFLGLASQAGILYALFIFL